MLHLQQHLQEFADQYGESHPDLLQAVIDLAHLDQRNRKTSQQITQGLIQGNQTHTQVKTKVQALPMDGVNLFDGIDGSLPQLDQTLAEKKTQKPGQSVKVEKVPIRNNNQTQIINLDEFQGEANPNKMVHASNYSDNNQNAKKTYMASLEIRITR